MSLESLGSFSLEEEVHLSSLLLTSKLQDLNIKLHIHIYVIFKNLTTQCVIFETCTSIVLIMKSMQNLVFCTKNVILVSFYLLIFVSKDDFLVSFP